MKPVGLLRKTAAVVAAALLALGIVAGIASAASAEEFDWSGAEVAPSEFDWSGAEVTPSEFDWS